VYTLRITYLASFPEDDVAKKSNSMLAIQTLAGLAGLPPWQQLDLSFGQTHMLLNLTS
jgi:hypothetical protein